LVNSDLLNFSNIRISAPLQPNVSNDWGVWDCFVFEVHGVSIVLVDVCFKLILVQGSKLLVEEEVLDQHVLLGLNRITKKHHRVICREAVDDVSKDAVCVLLVDYKLKWKPGLIWVLKAYQEVSRILWIRKQR